MSKTFKADNSVFFQTIEIIRLELQEHFWISCLRRVFRQSKYTSKNFSPYFHPNQTCGAKSQHSLDEWDKIKPVEKLSRYLFLCLPAPPNGKNFAKSSLTFIKAFSWIYKCEKTTIKPNRYLCTISKTIADIFLMFRFFFLKVVTKCDVKIENVSNW